MAPSVRYSATIAPNQILGRERANLGINRSHLCGFAHFMIGLFWDFRGVRSSQLRHENCRRRDRGQALCPRKSRNCLCDKGSLASERLLLTHRMRSASKNCGLSRHSTSRAGCETWSTSVPESAICLTIASTAVLILKIGNFLVSSKWRVCVLRRAT